MGPTCGFVARDCVPAAIALSTQHKLRIGQRSWDQDGVLWHLCRRVYVRMVLLGAALQTVLEVCLSMLHCI